MRTYSAKKGDVERQWWLVDASGKTLGRLAVQIANILRGKDKPEYTPHTDTGDFVVVTNSKKIKLTGKKLDQKKYYSHSSYFGNLKQQTARELLEKKPEVVLTKAVKGMLPKNRLSRKLIKKLKVFPGETHTHQSQKPKAREINV